jgi:hypothetical protein
VAQIALAAAVADLTEMRGQGCVVGEIQVGGVVEEEDDAGAVAFEAVEDGDLVTGEEGLVGDGGMMKEAETALVAGRIVELIG